MAFRQPLKSDDDPEVALSIIFQNNRYGFIDSTGKIIIEPVFVQATDFSEGLAAARINSKYGFINGTGKFVIEPKYEYAEEFKNGVALVYIDTIPAFLFKDGRELKVENFKKIRFFEKDRAYARTYSKKEGVINHKYEKIYGANGFKEN